MPIVVGPLRAATRTGEEDMAPVALAEGVGLPGSGDGGVVLPAQATSSGTRASKVPVRIDLFMDLSRSVVALSLPTGSLVGTISGSVSAGLGKG